MREARASCVHATGFPLLELYDARPMRSGTVDRLWGILCRILLLAATGLWSHLRRICPWLTCDTTVAIYWRRFLTGASRGLWFETLLR
ncbi:hypothetical protein GCM10018952_72880 [Streptosporangium vulgare]